MQLRYFENRIHSISMTFSARGVQPGQPCVMQKCLVCQNGLAGKCAIMEPWLRIERPQSTYMCQSRTHCNPENPQCFRQHMSYPCTHAITSQESQKCVDVFVVLGFGLGDCLMPVGFHHSTFPPEASKGREDPEACFRHCSCTTLHSVKQSAVFPGISLLLSAIRQSAAVKAIHLGCGEMSHLNIRREEDPQRQTSR